MKYKHIFGPVPSRRLGTSLGIDLTPQNTCTLNCLYCECGRTRNVTSVRREYVPTGEVLTELRDFLSTCPELDSITFSGSGEPTLHSGIEAIIEMLKNEYPQYRVTVLTNGTLLTDASVRAALRRADLVVPSLDAVSEDVFREINRPLHGLRNEEIIEGLVAFSEEYPGEIWLEVFIIPGINDSEDELLRFRELFPRLRVTRIQLNSLDRPGAVDWILPMPRENLEALARRFGDAVEVIGRPMLRHRCAAYSDDIENRILAAVRVRPCTLEDVCVSLDMHPLDAGKYLDVLLNEGKLISKKGERGVFYMSRRGEE